jgi:hypothetical protein
MVRILFLLAIERRSNRPGGAALHFAARSRADRGRANILAPAILQFRVAERKTQTQRKLLLRGDLCLIPPDLFLNEVDAASIQHVLL